jgi:hypothetical protein
VSETRARSGRWEIFTAEKGVVRKLTGGIEIHETHEKARNEKDGGKMRGRL